MNFFEKNCNMLIPFSNFILPRECTSEAQRRTRFHDNMQTRGDAQGHETASMPIENVRLTY